MTSSSESKSVRKQSWAITNETSISIGLLIAIIALIARFLSLEKNIEAHVSDKATHHYLRKDLAERYISRTELDLRFESIDRQLTEIHDQQKTIYKKLIED